MQSDFKPPPLIKYFLFLIIFLRILPSIAQYDVSGLDLSKDVSVWFDDQLGLDQSQLVAGKYQSTFISVNSHPFYSEKQWINGAVKYRDQVYSSVDMIYNIFDDYLLIKHPTNLNISNQPIKLETGQIDWFILKDAEFRNYKSLTEQSGYYEQLYDGQQLKMVAKRIKKEVIKQSNEPIGYEQDDKFYMVINNSLIAVRNKKSFAKAFPELKNDIKVFLKKEALFVTTRNESSLIETSRFCDEKLSEK